MYNKVVLIGNLGKDPEIRHLENGNTVARLTLATNESYKDKDGNWQNLTEWHNVVAWRTLADNAERNMKKGSMVFVEGKLKTRGYKDQNGVEKFMTEIEALTLRSLDKRERGIDGAPMSSDQDYKKPISNTGYSSSVNQEILQKEELPNFLSNEEDDLPF
ncbi:MAG TPA: single-stranded DNA-binding protein [Saprospiraceae bacterium]|nr:single-stranded DNA-binding protein [Saprospiraceae bacterium]